MRLESSRGLRSRASCGVTAGCYNSGASSITGRRGRFSRTAFSLFRASFALLLLADLPDAVLGQAVLGADVLDRHSRSAVPADGLVAPGVPA
jgi:hypothetical protein